jgi:uncharacterized protein (TIGR03067 family)
MKKSLPPRPNLEHLRTQAKKLLADLRAGKPDAARIFIDYLPAAATLKPDEVHLQGFRLADAQSAIARQSGFAAWPGLARHIEQLRGLEGEWHFASLEVDGHRLSSAMLGGSRLLIDGDRFRMESPDAVYEGIFRIDVDVDPAHIDIEFIEGPEAGNWSYGIYRFDGVDLVLCLGLTGAQRPAHFTTAAGSGHALERLHRASRLRPENVDGGQRPPARVTETADVDESAFTLAMTPLLEHLQGDWIPVTMVSNGQAIPASMLAFGKRTMKGNETRVVFNGQTMVHARVRIDESTRPHAVDYLNIGSGPRVVTQGVLELRDGVVRICMASPGAPRPGGFRSVAGDQLLFSEWKRK